MSIYTKHLNNKKTQQTEQIPGIPQVKNNAGGYVFAMSDRTNLERFLTLGTEGGTYYVDEKKLTIDNAKMLIEMIRRNGKEVVDTILAFIDPADGVQRAPRPDPAIFALALCCTYGDELTKRNAYNFIHAVCTTSTHLFTFCQMIQDLRGWSRGLRSGVSRWYDNKTDNKLEYQLVKYRQRNGWTHRDVLRLIHRKPSSERENYLFKYACGKIETPEQLNGQYIFPFETLQRNPDPKIAVKLIQESNLTWEMIPTELLNHPTVLEALLEKMPLTAMMRNLNRFAIAGLTELRTSDATKHICDALGNQEHLRKSRIHPINVLNTLKTYSQGHGFRGGKTWTPQPKIVDALQDAFEMSFGNVTPTGKRILVATDVSGSMQMHPIANMALKPLEAAAALMLCYVRNEENAELIYFDTKIHAVKAAKRTSYNELFNSMKQICGGGTDCSLPYAHAVAKKIKGLDAIISFTDSETWAGHQHPIQTYAYYKTHFNPECKGVVVAMTATGKGLFPDEDTKALNVSGFDAAIPMLVSNFIKG